MSSKKRIPAGFRVLIIILAVALAVGCAQTATSPATSPAELLSLGERFLLEMNYEQALVQFLQVIEIEPMNARAYYGAARAHIGLGQRDEAIDILRRGIEMTGDAQLQALLDELLLEPDAESEPETGTHGVLSGDGSEASPFLLSTPEHMEWMQEQWPDVSSSHFRMIADIEMPDTWFLGRSSREWNVDWDSWDYEKFIGVFDGGGFAISLDIANEADSWGTGGLFHTIGDGGVVKNLYVVGSMVCNIGSNQVGSVAVQNHGTILNVHVSVYITASWNTGGVVYGNSGTIDNSSFSGMIEINESNVGGIASLNVGEIRNSRFHGDVIGRGVVGGIVGSNGGLITDSYSAGTVSGGEGVIGGVAGGNSDGGIIENSYSSSDVTGSSIIGGLSGDNRGVIENSHASGTVSADIGAAGGLVGINLSVIENSSASGSVFGGNNPAGVGGGFSGSGGLVGVNGQRNRPGIVRNSSASGSVSGPWYVGQLIGFCLDANGSVN